MVTAKITPLCQLHLDEPPFELAAVGIVAEVDGTVPEDAVQTEVIAFEDGGFGLAVDFLDLVDGFLRDDEVAGDDDREGIEADGMGYGTDSRAVLAQFREVAVTDEPGFVSMGQLI